MLELKHLSFEVNDDKGEKGIIKDISLKVNDGKFVVITGPNGGGKSTTAKLIMGIERPTGGQIFFDGEDIYYREEHYGKSKNGHQFCFPAASPF